MQQLVRDSVRWPSLLCAVNVVPRLGRSHGPGSIPSLYTVVCATISLAPEAAAKIVTKVGEVVPNDDSDFDEEEFGGKGKERVRALPLQHQQAQVGLHIYWVLLLDLDCVIRC
jgi:hypothetical protein